MTKRSKYWLSISLCILVVLAAFMGGGIIEPFRSKLFKRIYIALQQAPLGTASSIDQVGPSPQSASTLDSALLPLEIRKADLSQLDQFVSTAGAICEINYRIIVVDRIGNAYAHQPEKAQSTRLKWPPIPNNYKKFTGSKIKRKETNFRVHGLLCAEKAGKFDVFVAHEFYDPATDFTHMVVSQLVVDTGLVPDVNMWKQVYISKPLPGTIYAANGAGGRLALDSFGTLLLTIGDYNIDGVFQPGKVAQQHDSNFGGVFQIDLKTGNSRRLTMGQRNPQGIVLSSTGVIYTVEHGPKGGDELNRIVDGRNYGWPISTYGTDYTSYDWPDQKQVGRHIGFDAPVFAWLPSIAPTQIIEIKKFHERWKGDFIVASLKASSLYRIRMEDGVVRYVEPIWIGARIRDVIETAAGDIVLWTDAGELLTIKVDLKSLLQNERSEAAVLQPKSLDCMNCHHVGSTNQTHLAPSLSRIFGRDIGSDAFENYSDSLKNAEGTWTEEKLRAFLTDPESFASGTTMPAPDLSLNQLDKAIEYLRTLD